MPAAARAAARAYFAMSPALVAGTTLSALVFIDSLLVPRKRGRFVWHARRDSNPQPAVLETAALPIELLAYRVFRKWRRRLAPPSPFPGVGPALARRERPGCYLMIFATTPAPTVRPPSR